MKTYFYLLLALGCLVPTLTAAEEFKEGQTYKRILPKIPTDSEGKAEVMEFFWYGCPHCYRMEVPLNKWLKTKPTDVVFRPLPAIFSSRPSMIFHAQVYYTARALDVIEKTHSAFYEQLHELKKKITTPDQAAVFFAEFGVKRDSFDRAWNSFAVKIKVNRAKELTRRYGINSVPTFTVNGQYITDNTLTGSSKKTMQLIDYLIKK